MKKQKNLYLAVDIDGTLLNSDGKVSEATLNYLSNEWDNGVIFVTGRNEHDSQEVTGLFPTKGGDYYVVYNDGQDVAEITEANEYKQIYTFPYLEAETVKKIMHWAKCKKADFVMYYRDFTLSVINDRGFIGIAIIRLLSHNSNNKFVSGNKIDQIQKENVLKIAINKFGNSSADEMYEALLSSFGKEIYAVKNDGMIEIKNKLSTKLNALNYLFEKILKVDGKRNCIYIGNGGNDVASLTYFVNSYAVANAMPEAKLAANQVTASNDNDGVVKALVAFLEGNEDGE